MSQSYKRFTSEQVKILDHRPELPDNAVAFHNVPLRPGDNSNTDLCSAGQEGEDEGVDLVGCFPHRDVTTLLDDLKC